MSVIEAIIGERRRWTASTPDLSLMKPAGVFLLPSPYHAVYNAAAPSPPQPGKEEHLSLMPASWKWVTAPRHVVHLYPKGALCSGAKEHGSPRSLTFSAAAVTAALIKPREKSKCLHRVAWRAAGTAWALGFFASCRVPCVFHIFLPELKWMNIQQQAEGRAPSHKTHSLHIVRANMHCYFQATGTSGCDKRWKDI